MEKRTSILAIAVLALALVTALGACGKDSSPTAPTAPACRAGTLSATPLAGATGFYVLSLDPPGGYTLSINGVSRSIEFGSLVTAQSGDLVQACRDCAGDTGLVCAPAQVLR